MSCCSSALFVIIPISREGKLGFLPAKTKTYCFQVTLLESGNFKEF